MKTLFKTTALALATSSLLLAGCGGGSSDNDSNTPQVAPKGKVIDFYLSGATVRFDGCNGQTTVTDTQGGFNFPANCFESTVTVTGGTDIGTSLPFNGVLRALAIPNNRATLVVVSPITTIISYTDAGIANTAKFAQQLGITNQNFLLIDPMTNSEVLQTTVVTQQLLNQIQSLLIELSDQSGTTLTPEQASQAATKALSSQMVARVNSNSTTSGLTETAFIQSVIENSVRNASANLSAELQANIDAVAKNTAAIAAATIQQKVEAVNDAMEGFTVKGSPAETLAALQAGGQTATIRTASLSQAAPEALDAVFSLITNTNPATQAALQALGVAIGSGTGIADAANALNQTLPANQQLPADVIDDLENIETYNDFIQLVNAGFNGNAQTYSVQQLANSSANNAPLAVTGGFNSVQLNMNKMGNPFKTGFSEAKVGLSYTINNANTLNIVVDKVNLGFDNAGKLTSASIPQGTNYSFTTAGTQTTSVQSANLAVDNLTVTNGTLSLPVDVFLNKASNKSSAFKAAMASYTPKSGDKVSIKVSMGATANTTVRVGSGNGTPATSITVNAGQASLLGQGVNAQLAIQ
ncbi:hypothetical protein BKE30_01225 [Alkanindiges hydrocarboniclasticus]|uniref:Uncharacterized protein n=1 Tax=Alkanindiges hydrocarboniclasticus TaxID=1907941 RepID=A0A1S8CY72_9GAMM|nr:hypothetical protein [Alkanindiges hydrocarboniclasticus]ONG42149.1 hypothetical protein BKE30_01225 [Alkanindiges hydrocarboniclasticus]